MRFLLMEIIAEIKNVTETHIIPQVVSAEPEYVADGAGVTNLLSTIVGAKEVLRNVSSTTRNTLAYIFNSIRQRIKNSKKGLLSKPAIAGFGNFSLREAIEEERVDTAIDARIQENVALIQSIPEQYFKDLQIIVSEGMTNGETSNSIVSQIRNLYPVTEKRAKLIARDQIGKAYADLDRIRQQEAGVVEYMWQTVEDNRVRPSHAENNGKIFRWDSPPETGHPGTEINCRCIAIPLVEL